MAETKAKTKSQPTVGAAWRSRKGLFALVPTDDAERVTGHTSEELREIHGVQTVTRIYADGSREEALRVPSELVIESPEDGSEVVSDPDAPHRKRTAGRRG